MGHFETRLTFSEDVDATTVAASDFTVAGVAPSAAVVGTTPGNKNVYLTVAAQAPDAKSAVKVVGSVDLPPIVVPLLMLVQPRP